MFQCDHLVAAAFMKDSTHLSSPRVCVSVHAANNNGRVLRQVLLRSHCGLVRILQDLSAVQSVTVNPPWLCSPLAVLCPERQASEELLWLSISAAAGGAALAAATP